MKKKIALRVVPVIFMVLSLLWLAVPPQQASAHPLGEATISQYSALTVAQNRVDVRYIVDMAEIPAFQELRAIGPGRTTGTDLTDAERTSYLASKSAELMRGLSLTVDGSPLLLSVNKTDMTFPPGNGGLPTLRFEMCLSAPLNGKQSGTLHYTVGNYEGRKGWNEQIAVSASGVKLDSSSVPTTDITNGLTVYKIDVVTSPPEVHETTLTFSPGPASAKEVPEAGLCGTSQTTTGGSTAAMTWAGQRNDPFAFLLNDKSVPIVFMLVLAFGFGAAHAMSPGHGKTIVAAYLVGTRGTIWHAGILGITVTISHTIGVFLLGIAVLSFSQYILPDTIFPILSLISGLLICLVGIVLFAQRLRSWKHARAEALAVGHVHAPDHVHEHASEAAHTHDHDHGHTHDGVSFHSHEEHTHDHNHDHNHDHDHDHAHSHENEHSHDAMVPHKHGMFGKAHTHLPADDQKVTMGSLLTLGITGGIIPCPSALVVLLVAVNTNQVALGLLLIVAFSLGLASVLTALGIMVVYGKGVLGRLKFDTARLKTGAILGKLPMASALAVSCLGLLIAFSSITTR